MRPWRVCQYLVRSRVLGNAATKMARLPDVIMVDEALLVGPVIDILEKLKAAG
jgi:hypothetical protein